MINYWLMNLRKFLLPHRMTAPPPLLAAVSGGHHPPRPPLRFSKPDAFRIPASKHMRGWLMVLSGFIV
jgi:hypothetical protein